MIAKTVISRKNLFDLRAKAIGSTGEVIDLNEADYDILSINLASLVIAITPYEEIFTTMTYDNSANEVETKTVKTSDEIDSIVQPAYSTSDFMHKKTFESIEDAINHVKDLISFRAFDNTVDFELFIDNDSEDIITIDSNFTNQLFKSFKGNVKFYGNNASSLHFSSTELEITSLTVEKFKIYVDKIVLFHVNSFDIKNCKLNGFGTEVHEPDQLVFYAKATSNFSYIDIESSIRIGFSGVVTSQYKWQNTSLNISYINIDFVTNGDKDKKYDHIFKITDFYTIICNNVAIKQKMTKLVPFKFDRCNSLNFYNYENIYRPKDKGTNEISINDLYRVNILSMKVIAEDTNSKATSAISISSFEEYGEVFLYDVEVQNVDLLSMANSELDTLQLSKLNISTSQSVFDLEDSENYIDQLIISDSNIETSSFSIPNQHNVNINNCTVESSDNMEISSFQTLIKDSTLISKKDMNLTTTGYELDEETPTLSIVNSLINATANIIVSSEREESNLSYNLARIKCNKDYTDKSFTNVTFSEAKFECKTLNFLSSAYNLTDTIIQNDLFTSEKPVLFTGTITGTIEISYESNTKSGIVFKRDLPEENYSPDTDSVEIKYNNNFQDIQLINEIFIENYCLNILQTAEDESTKAIANYHIVDNTPEQYYYQSGLYLYKDADSTNIEHYIKNLTVDKNAFIFYNDGSSESDSEKLNYGIQP